MSYGWGTGGIQVTASVIGQSDTLKVIDQGADDNHHNAVNIRRFFRKVCGNQHYRTVLRKPTLIQTRHRIPETPLQERQIMVYQVPMPRTAILSLRPSRTEANKNATPWKNSGPMYVRLYERHYQAPRTYRQGLTTTRSMVNDRYLMNRPGPIPRFDNPKLHMNPPCSYSGRDEKNGVMPCRLIRKLKVSILRVILSPLKVGISPANSAARGHLSG